MAKKLEDLLTAPSSNKQLGQRHQVRYHAHTKYAVNVGIAKQS